MKNLIRLFFVFAAVLTLLSFFPATTTASVLRPDLKVLTPELKVEIGNFGSKTDFESGYKEGEGVEQCPYGEGQCIEVGWLGQYINAIFRYGVGLAAILTVVMIMVGGFIWLTSGGSPDKVGRAKEYITSSIVGLLLALFSYVILYTINPRLVANEPLVIKNVKPIISSCCLQKDGTTYQYEYVPVSGLCQSGLEPSDDQSLCAQCCCVTQGLERGCKPSKCEGACFREGRFYESKSCESLGVTIKEVECPEAPIVSTPEGECCCIQGDPSNPLVRGCTLKGDNCNDTTCSASYPGRSVYPRTCGFYESQALDVEGDCEIKF